MSAIAEQIAATLAARRDQMPDAVVTVTHFYQSAGTVRTQQFTAERGSMTAQQRLAITGSATSETFPLILDIAGLDVVPPKEGDRVRVQVGEDAPTDHTVITRNEDPLRCVMTLIVGPKNG